MFIKDKIYGLKSLWDVLYSFTCNVKISSRTSQCFMVAGGYDVRAIGDSTDDSAESPRGSYWVQEKLFITILTFLNNFLLWLRCEHKIKRKSF